jgi:N6-adenosine-specific RNA methylase IME4
MAVAAESFAKAALDDEAVREAVDVKLEAQRKAGQVLTKMAKNGERQVRGGDRKSDQSNSPVTLNVLGITKNQSSLWQKQGALPAREWAAYKQVAFDRVGRVFKKFFGGDGHESESPPLPAGVFDVILADPPWQYDFAETDSRKVENQYPTMSVEEIAALAVPSADSAVLYLWATAPKLREALTVLSAWGFEYTTNLVWVKPQIGMGYWARGRHELLLVGTKGEPRVPKPANRPESVIESPRTRHSAKPDEVRRLIEKALPSGTRLQLFAREEWPGWTSWGNEL